MSIANELKGSILAVGESCREDPGGNDEGWDVPDEKAGEEEEDEDALLVGAETVTTQISWDPGKTTFPLARRSLSGRAG